MNSHRGQSLFVPPEVPEYWSSRNSSAADRLFLLSLLNFAHSLPSLIHLSSFLPRGLGPAEATKWTLTQLRSRQHHVVKTITERLVWRKNVICVKTCLVVSWEKWRNIDRHYLIILSFFLYISNSARQARPLLFRIFVTVWNINQGHTDIFCWICVIFV